MTAKVKRERRKEDRPGEILEAAFEEFSQRGFAGTRLDDVAARAGVTKGTIYLYFVSKEDLFVEMVRERCRPANEQLQAAAASPQGPAFDILRRHLETMWGMMVEDRRGGELLRVMVADGPRFPDLADRWFVEIIEPALEGLRTILRYGCERGEFRGSAILDFPQLLMAPVIAACTWTNIFGERRPLDFDAMFDAALDHLEYALVGPAAGATSREIVPQ